MQPQSVYFNIGQDSLIQFVRQAHPLHADLHKLLCVRDAIEGFLAQLNRAAVRTELRRDGDRPLSIDGEEILVRFGRGGIQPWSPATPASRRHPDCYIDLRPADRAIHFLGVDIRSWRYHALWPHHTLSDAFTPEAVTALVADIIND